MKGISVPIELGVQNVSGLDYQWFYNWADRVADFADPKFVPMIWKTPSNDMIAKANNFPGRYWLLFNEPNRADQANLTPAVAATIYQTVYSQIGNKAKLVVGGVGTDGGSWLSQFLGKIVAWPPAGIHVHLYGWGTTESDWAKYVVDLKALKTITQSRFPNCEFWLTETGYLSGTQYGHTPEFTLENWMNPLIKIVPLVGFDRVCWFTSYGTKYPASNLMNSVSGGLTVLGQEWNRYENQEDPLAACRARVALLESKLARINEIIQE